MKKYIITLIPFVFCTILSIFQWVKNSIYFPDPVDGNLDNVSVAWFIIGIAISGIFIGIFIINDVFDYVTKVIGKKRIGLQTKESTQKID